MEFVVKDIIVIFRKIKTILILISFKCYFSHPEKSILKPSLTIRRHCNSGPWFHIFVEIDREIFSTVILFPLLIQEGLVSVKSESMCMKY